MSPHCECGKPNYCQISNFLGIFPVYLAFKFKLYWIALAMSIASVCSIIYHHNEQNDDALYADLFGCALLSACTFYIFFNMQTIPSIANILSFIYSGAAITFYYMAGLPEEEQYELYHTAWHVFALYSFTLFVYAYINTTIITEESLLTKQLVISMPTQLKGRFQFIPIPIKMK